MSPAEADGGRAPELVSEARLLVATGRIAEAIPLLNEAARLHRRAGNTVEAHKCEGLSATAEDVLVRLTVGRASDREPDLRSDELTLETLEALRHDALVQCDPLAYLLAALAIAELSDQVGDRLGSYAALATGVVTLVDLVGPEGRRLVEPKLRGLLERWGPAEFSAVKASYEDIRRRSMTAEAP